MKLTGYELELKYIHYIAELGKVKNGSIKKYWLDNVWMRPYRKRIKKRLKQLEKDFEKGYVHYKAYIIYKKMLNEVL